MGHRHITGSMCGPVLLFSSTPRPPWQRNARNHPPRAVSSGEPQVPSSQSQSQSLPCSSLSWTRQLGAASAVAAASVPHGARRHYNCRRWCGAPASNGAGGPAL